MWVRMNQRAITFSSPSTATVYTSHRGVTPQPQASDSSKVLVGGGGVMFTDRALLTSVPPSATAAVRTVSFCEAVNATLLAEKAKVLPDSLIPSLANATLQPQAFPSPAGGHMQRIVPLVQQAAVATAATFYMAFQVVDLKSHASSSTTCRGALLSLASMPPTALT